MACYLWAEIGRRQGASHVNLEILYKCMKCTGTFWDPVQLQPRVDDWHLVLGNTMYELSAVL